MNDSTSRKYPAPNTAPAVAYGGLSVHGEVLPWTKPTPEEAAEVVGLDRVLVVEVKYRGVFTFTKRVTAA